MPPLTPQLPFELTAKFRIGLIWAQTPTRVIGVNGTMPWHLPEDLAHFKAMTLGHYVLHGRSSYEALPHSLRPLPERKNIVLTSSSTYVAPGATIVHSLADAYRVAAGAPLWVLGGGNVYAQAIPDADLLVITEVDLRIHGDTYAPTVNNDDWYCAQRTTWIEAANGTRFRISEYRRTV